MTWNRNAVAALVGGVTLLVGGGTALAAQGGAQSNGDRAARCQARLAKIAEKRGVSVQRLEADMKSKLAAGVDAALAAGRISAERAAQLKERIAQIELCKGAKAKVARPGMLRAAADYLGLSAEELRAQLPGTSLAALAAKQGKSVERLKDAMLAPWKERLAKSVQSARIKQAQADRLLERLEQLVDRLVEKSFPAAG